MLTITRNPTVEVDLYTAKGKLKLRLSIRTTLICTGMFRAEVPSGASTGIYEAVELRDKGNDYMGKGQLAPLLQCRHIC